MSVVNDFLPFCPTDTGTNLLEQSDYAAAANRTIGNQPGVASSALVNKAIRQPAYIASQLAQLIANITNTNVNDDATPAKLLAQMYSAFAYLPPVLTVHTSGTGTQNTNYYFGLGSANATAGATYTNNGITFTVAQTIAAGALLQASGPGMPTFSGTLTKASGTGDSTITFYCVRMPLRMRVRMVGGGGGASGAAVATSGNAGAGSAGTATTFGTSLLVANPGGGAAANGPTFGGSGGTASLGTGPIGIAQTGAVGNYGGQCSLSAILPGGNGADSPFTGAGPGSGNSAVPNTGSGGGGSQCDAGYSGSGGGSGGYIDANIINPAAISTFPFAVGTGGPGGTAGTGGGPGGDGGSGIILTEEHYQ